MFHCVIFDFGDTLSDSESSNKKVNNLKNTQKILEKHGFNKNFNEV